MEHLRLFENYKSDEEIHKICKKCNIRSYTINKDGSIDVDGDVDLKFKGLIELPLTFNKVNGDFDCGENKLASLKGSPRIVNGSFWCDNNDLTDFIGGPDEVEGIYTCDGNIELTSLEGIAKIINSYLYMNSCNLNDFKGIPEDLYVGGEIEFYDNPVYINLKKFLRKYNINIMNIQNKYLDLILDINDFNAIQDGKIVDIRMDEVLYNIGLI